MQTVLLDACVLVPMPLADTLLSLAEAQLFHPAWSDLILEETSRALTTKLGVTKPKADTRLDYMRLSFPDARVVGFEHLIPQLTNHPKDRHVLAAAIAGRANTIVTANTKDFPDHSVQPHGIQVATPDEFLITCLEDNPESVLTCLQGQRHKYMNPPVTVEEFYTALSKVAPKFAQQAMYAE